MSSSREAAGSGSRRYARCTNTAHAIALPAFGPRSPTRVRTDRMRLQVEVCSVRAVMDTRSVLELSAREYYKPDPRRRNSDTDRVNGFVKGSVTTPQPLSHEHLPSAPSTLRPRPRTRAVSPCSYARGRIAALQVLVNAGDESPKPNFEGLLKERPEQLRVILSTAGFKGSSATWDRNALCEDLLNLYSHLSSQVENSYLVRTLPFTGWCLGGPCALHSTPPASSAPLHRPLGPSVAQPNRP